MRRKTDISVCVVLKVITLEREGEASLSVKRSVEVRTVEGVVVSCVVSV